MRSNVRMACDSGSGAIVQWTHIQFIIKLYGISAQTHSRVGANKLTATAAHSLNRSRRRLPARVSFVHSVDGVISNERLCSSLADKNKCSSTR